MDSFVRFSPFVRRGLKFRSRFDAAKREVRNRTYAWYPYDSFANLFYLQILMKKSGLSLGNLENNKTILDAGAADGALSFFFESLGFHVEAWDYAPTNMNRMAGLYDLAQILGSGITVQNINLDDAFNISSRFDLCLLLGLLYHLKNPFYVLEKLARHTQFCFLSTRIARQDPDGAVNFGNLPVAYLVDADQCNNDATNFWIFSPAGLMLLAHRTGWDICLGDQWLAGIKSLVTGSR